MRIAHSLPWLIMLILLGLGGRASAMQTVHFVSTDYPPYFTSAMPENGTLVAIAKAAFRASGYDLQIEFHPWARAMAEVEAGKYDGIVAVWYTAERAQYLAYSEPLATSMIGFYRRRDQRIDVSQLDSLKSYLIGTVHGYANPPAFDAAALRTEVAVDDLTNLRKLAAGRVDLILIDKAVSNYLIQRELPEATDLLTWCDPPVLTMPLYLGISKRHAQYPALMQAFNRGLETIRRTGEFQRILKRLPLVQ